MPKNGEHINEILIEEAGRWRAWPMNLIAEIPTEETLQTLVYQPRNSYCCIPFPVIIRHTKRLVQDELWLHAFRTSKGRIWDCINGWRQR